MRRNAFVCLCAAILSAFCVGSVGAQSHEGQTVAPGALPGPFVEEEKAPFLKNLRRFEIVSFGAFPVMLLYMNLGYEAVEYIRYGSYSNDLTDSQTLCSIGIACALSLGVGAVDAIIRAIRSHGKREALPRVDSP
jgi:hypothetical protein